MNPTVDVIGTVEAAAMFAEVGRQLPFAAAQTLNGLANGTQALTRDDVRGDFVLRKPTFILNTIYRKPGEDFANKSNLLAAVRVDDRRDLLAKFETGGTKQNPDHRIAIPLAVRRNKRDIVTAANRPAALLQKPRVAIVRNVIRQTIGKGRAAATRVLYLLRPSVTIPDKLNMRENAETIATRDFERIAGAAIDKALATARR